MLTPDIIDKHHLSGINVLGIYPMLADETCYFLAIDFDGEVWKRDLSVVRALCTEKNIPFAAEQNLFPIGK